MVLIREFRFVLPMSLEEYEIAGMYTILKMEQQNTTSKEGVEILQRIPFEDEHLGKGQHTSKVYHLESKIPPWLRTFAPAKALTLQEESWSAFPKSKTVLKCSRFKQCSMTIESVNKADNGCSENVHGLSKELLSQRKVEIIDIASVSCDYWSKIIGTAKLDFSKFISQKTHRGPLSKGWQSEKALLSEFHKLCFAWIDEWFGMTMGQILEMEKQNNLLLQKTFQKSFSTSKQDVKRKSKHEKQKIVDVSSIVPV